MGKALLLKKFCSLHEAVDVISDAISENVQIETVVRMIIEESLHVYWFMDNDLAWNHKWEREKLYGFYYINVRSSRGFSHYLYDAFVNNKYDDTGIERLVLSTDAGSKYEMFIDPEAWTYHVKEMHFGYDPLFYDVSRLAVKYDDIQICCSLSRKVKDEELNTKSFNCASRIIGALAEAVVDRLKGKHYADAQSVVAVLSKKGVECNFSEKQLTEYLKAYYEQ